MKYYPKRQVMVYFCIGIPSTPWSFYPRSSFIAVVAIAMPPVAKDADEDYDCTRVRASNFAPRP